MRKTSQQSEPSRQEKKPWLKQVDGDLNKKLWQSILTKNPLAIQATKVKGHCTAQMVQDGVGTWDQKHGNDNSDLAAGIGARYVDQGLYRLAEYCSERQNEYGKLMQRVHNMIIGVLGKAREYRLEESQRPEAQSSAGIDKHVVISQVVTDYTEERSREIRWRPYRRHPLDDDHQHLRKLQIYTFMRSQEWTEAQTSKMQQGKSHLTDIRQGRTWLELFALYESEGGAPRPLNHKRAIVLASNGATRTQREERDMRIIQL